MPRGDEKKEADLAKTQLKRDRTMYNKEWNGEPKFTWINESEAEPADIVNSLSEAEAET